jgi:hypothetical protein
MDRIYTSILPTRCPEIESRSQATFRLTPRPVPVPQRDCLKRPAASERGDRRGRNLKAKRGCPSRRRMLCGWRCGCRLTASGMRTYFTERCGRNAGVAVAPGSRRASFVRVARNYRPMLIVMCLSAATQSNILFSFETDLLQRLKLDWSNRAASVAPPCIRVSSVRQESHRRAADDHFHPSRKTGRDWPVMCVIRTEPMCFALIRLQAV